MPTPESSPVKLHAYRHSVYCWIVRLALAEKGVAFENAEINPFELDDRNVNSNPHPFNRVPVLVHGDVRILETSAICRYIDEAFDGPALQPDLATDRARMNQIISVVDSYGYWPLVRQVYAHDVFARRFGEQVNEAEIKAGLEAAGPVLRTLEDLAANKAFLVTDSPTLADIHLAPVLDYYCQSDSGMKSLAAFPGLSAWLKHFSGRSTFQTSKPA